MERIVLPDAAYGDYHGAVWKNDRTLAGAGRAAAVTKLLGHSACTNAALYEARYPDGKKSADRCVLLESSRFSGGCFCCGWS